VSKPAVRDVDNIALHLAQPLVPVAELVHDACREVLAHYVGDGNQAFEEPPPVVVLQVDGDAALLDIVLVERSAGIDTGRPVPHRVAPALGVPHALPDWILDPDDVCAHRRQEPRAAGSGKLARQIRNTNAFQCPRTHELSLPSGDRKSSLDRFGGSVEPDCALRTVEERPAGHRLGGIDIDDAPETLLIGFEQLGVQHVATPMPAADRGIYPDPHVSPSK
jgi:hypothetical protein